MPTNLLDIFQNLKKEQALALKNGISSVSKKTVLLVDGYNLFLRVFSSINELNSNGEHVGGISGFFKSLGYAIKLNKPDRVVIVFDGAGGSSKRRKLYPEYKNHRKSKVRLNRVYEEELDLNEEEKSMKRQLLRIVEYIQYLPLNLISLQNVEADDSIAFLAQDYFKNEISIIMSTDKDFLQLVNDHIKVWSPTKKKLYGVEGVVEDFFVYPKNFGIWRSIDGDKGDNIKKIRGAGLKTIVKAFPFLSEDRKIEFSEIYNYAENNKGKLKIYENILNNKEMIELNFKLMELYSSSINAQEELNIYNLLNRGQNKFVKLKFIKMLIEDKVINSFGNIEKWIEEVISNKLDKFVIQERK